MRKIKNIFWKSQNFHDFLTISSERSSDLGQFFCKSPTFSDKKKKSLKNFKISKKIGNGKSQPRNCQHCKILTDRKKMNAGIRITLVWVCYEKGWGRGEEAYEYDSGRKILNPLTPTRQIWRVSKFFWLPI